MKAIPTTLIVCFLLLFAGAAGALTADGETPAVEQACNTQSGAAFGLCNAYCEAMDCHLAYDADPATEPHASPNACSKVESKFYNFTAKNVPCADLVTCPCAEPSSWTDQLAGWTWQTVALGGFSVIDSTCSDDGTVTRIDEDIPDVSFSGALVDSAALVCHAYDSFGTNETLSITAAEAAACVQLLLNAGGSLCQ